MREHNHKEVKPFSELLCMKVYVGTAAFGCPRSNTSPF